MDKHKDDLRVTTDEKTGAHYIYVDARRKHAKTIQVGNDENVMADLDQDGKVVGIEILKVGQ